MGLVAIGSDERTLVLHLSASEHAALVAEYENLVRYSPSVEGTPLSIVAKALLMARIMIRVEQREKQNRVA